MQSIIEYMSDDGNFGVSLPVHVMSYIHSLCSASSTLETGGILIGSYSNDNRWAVICKATEPPIGSKRAMASFVRNGPAALQVLDRSWDDGIFYLGEWHYHPNASSNPSPTDQRTIRRFMQETKLHCPEPVMLIIGGNSAGWDEYVSVFTCKKEIILHRCMPIDNDNVEKALIKEIPNL